MGILDDNATIKIELDPNTLFDAAIKEPPRNRNGLLYVVGGFMRTGTSMMMGALVAGGLDAYYRESRDRMRRRHADEYYDPNQGGLWELERADYKRWDFPRGFEGYLIKGLNFCVPRMEMMPAGIRVVFMRRDTEEIKQSYEAFFGTPLRNVAHISRNMDSIIGRIENRRDVLSLDVFWFRNVVQEPLEHFNQLVRSGWPIDAMAAAQTINPDLCRFRRESLQAGVA